MKLPVILSAFLVATFCIHVSGQQLPVMNCMINALDNPDTFFVRVNIAGRLFKKPVVYNFVGTVPGTYQTMNIGRLVSDFRAYNKKGHQLETKKISVNQYEIAGAHQLKYITYKVAETFSAAGDSLPIALMAGSVIDAKYTLINPHTVLGYFNGINHARYKLNIIRPDHWAVATGIKKQNNYYVSNSFDELVDNSILCGELSYRDTIVSGSKIKVYCFSEEATFTAELLLSNLQPMLMSAKNFIGYLPVKEYTFLYCFPPMISGQTGAWEHSSSSMYLINDPGKNATPAEINVSLETLKSVSAHEFLHILTPLHVHSEIIDHFDYAHPVSSAHLWLYEGVTEWASLIMMYRSGVMPLDLYLSNAIRWKIQGSETFFKSQWSLQKIADSVYSPTGNRKYGDVYLKGAIVSTCLDIRLLELSGGKFGLRELLMQLVEKHNGKSFDEYGFFDELVQMTYPEIRQFIDDYIILGKQIPYNEFLQKIGLQITKANDELSGMQYIVSTLPVMSKDQLQLFSAWKINLPQ